jgi:hypothetical protein
MSDTVVISWNFTNWVTVILMALIGWAVYKMVTGFVQRRAAMA